MQELRWNEWKLRSAFPEWRPTPGPCLPIFAENSPNRTNKSLRIYSEKIYVGNLSFSMTEPELRSLFEPYAGIESASIATDRDTGRSRGFGFVSMSNDGEAKNAMVALNGKELSGRALTVNEARPQTERSGFRDNGRRGDSNSRQRREPRW